MGIRSAKNSRFLSTFILSAEPGFSIFYNCNSVYSKRTSDLVVPSKLAKLLDFIDLMKSVDFDQGGRNANEDRKIKNYRAEESQNFYKTF